MSQSSKIHLAILGGIFATGGSIFAKLSGLYDITNIWGLAAKATLLLTMLTLNTVGCTLYVRALAASGSSLPATVASSAVNYVCSAVAGWAIFGEAISARWWAGTSLVLLGLLLVCRAAPRPQESRPKRD